MAKHDLGGGLTASIEQGGAAAHVAIAGPITELSDFTKVKALKGAARIDLSGVDRINSLGVRNWCMFVREAEKDGLAMTFERCSPVIVEQISMISNFFGTKSQVASLQVPYFCESCSTEHTQLVERAPNSPISVPSTNTCPKCGKAATIDEPENMYEMLSKSLAGR